MTCKLNCEQIREQMKTIWLQEVMFACNPSTLRDRVRKVAEISRLAKSKRITPFSPVMSKKIRKKDSSGREEKKFKITIKEKITK